MQFNKLPYLQALREGEVYPPFGEIERLIMAHETRKPVWAIFARPMIEGSLVLLLAIAALLNFTPTPERIILGDAVPSPLRVSAPSVTVMHAAFSKSAVTTMHSLKGMSRSQIVSSEESQPFPKRSFDSVFPPVGQKKPKGRPAQDDRRRTEIPTPSAPSMVSTATLTEESTEMTKNWEAFISGAFIVPPSGIPSGALPQPFAASMGIRYLWNGSSSFILELRKNSFVSDQSSNATSFHEASFSLDGQTFQSVIGNASTPVAYNTTSVLSLDVGYHFELLPESIFSPFAEALIGGSISGAFTSESVGIRYAISSSLILAAGARADQLFSPSSSPKRALAFEAGAGFEW